MGGLTSLFAHEYEYKVKERRLKRIIMLLGVVCVVSVTINVMNARRAEQLRQGYMFSIWGNIRNLEVMLSGLRFELERGENPFENHSRTHGITGLEQIASALRRDIRELAFHQRINDVTVPEMRWLNDYVIDLIEQAVNGTPAQREVALNFLERRCAELIELHQDLTVEREGVFRGETIVTSSANVNMSTRQFFRLISVFTESVNDEAIKYFRLQSLNNAAANRAADPD